ncbi:hypothetical protein NM688_g8419 [Phlebia brevispora]|uniref:Uncharacterized protein n=1 Tax=Phlebia brevispora TaxID=194682 RepID=A0ACC1RRJ0_9APHY|nr:hypothetical protein NM688_g8419 [Phlebia brevispora]
MSTTLETTTTNNRQSSDERKQSPPAFLDLADSVSPLAPLVHLLLPDHTLIHPQAARYGNNPAELSSVVCISFS